MTTEEFSNEFDVLVNSFSRDVSLLNKDNLLNFNEYEKSVFLTKAQEDIIIELYNSKNQFLDSFEKTEEMRRYLSSLVYTVEITDKATDKRGLSSKSVFYRLPDNLWFITLELAKLTDEALGCYNNKYVNVFPIKQDSYFKIKDNPFRGTSKTRVLRFDIDDNTVELLSDYSISAYMLRYLRKPAPIIVQDLTDITINNISIKTNCELNPAIHRTILDRAVRYALLSRFINAGNQNV